MPKKLHIKTYGCQMNVYDSSRMADVLSPLGYEETADAAEADLVILNTCHIREKAAEKVYSDLGRLRDAREERRATGQGSMLIAVGGCVAQAEGEEMMKRAPYVDIVVGSQSYHHLPRLIREAETRSGQGPNGGGLELAFPQVQKFDLLPESVSPHGKSAFLSVQEGCDKFCTFCVVPYTRGAEYSRPVETVLREARQLVDKGGIEITLLGQNVNAYHGEDAAGNPSSLARLIERLAPIDGLRRIRYSTSHPRDMRDDLIEVHGSVEKLMPHLHLPVQSGSDRILKAMNRKHGAAEYLAIVEKLRKVRPDIAFSSDFIVGYPGETEADFAATLALVETVGYAQTYSYKYSSRPGTPAAEKGGQVAEDEKISRLARLHEVIARHQLAFNQASVGAHMDVLLDREGRRSGQRIGRSPWMQSVHVNKASHLADILVRVRITEAHPNSLTGELVESANAAILPFMNTDLCTSAA